MLQQVVWSVCIILEGLLLAQGARVNLLNEFPLFYVYVACVLAKDLVSAPLYGHYPSFYISFYWTTECLLAAISYGVLTEIYNQSLKKYPGAARFFKVLLFVVFIAIATHVAVSSLTATDPSVMRAIADLGRDLRQLQAVLLVCLLSLLAYYKIPMGKNLRGLLLGYALFIGADVITLTFIAHPATGFGSLMRGIDLLSYVAALVIWSISLWAPSPKLERSAPSKIEDDYQHLALETRTILLRARTHLARAGRP